jgi:fibronectin type 3 domain-containing protein
LRRASRLPVAVLAVLLFGIVGVVLFRAAANEKPHSVLLNWNPPPSQPGSTVTSYDVYRSLPDGTYQAIAVGVTATSYVDHDVSNGASYTYVVKAVDTHGNEGPPSNPATTVIP